MNDYNAPIDDIMFTLTELAIPEPTDPMPLNMDLTDDTLYAIVEQAGKFFSQVLAPLNQLGDKIGATLDEDGVKTPAGFKDAYRQLTEGGWTSLSFPVEEGGQGLPAVVDLAITEMMQSANASFTMCPGLAVGAASAIRALASAELKALYLPKLASGEWSAAMSLTEPQAGSDLSDMRTMAVRSGDNFLITGTKIFISWADHDMSENIVHLVLARTPTAPKGTRGISLFLVPKFIPLTGGAPGKRNDFSIVSIEKKLGLHASPTCTVNYGENEGATGYLVGQENQGLEAMFVMMNHARIQVGLQGASITESAYQQSLAYAKMRVQGYSQGQAAQVAIIYHADVRRMLLCMKSGIEAIRAIAYTTSMANDLAKNTENSVRREFHKTRVGIMTPIVKAWGTEFAQELVQHAVQIHGGAGYIEETGIAQYMRDMRITTIYEGTSAIQSMDLIRRKLLKDKGEGFRFLVDDMRAVVDSLEKTTEPLREIAVCLAQAIESLEEAIAWLLCNHDDVEVSVGAISLDFLMLAGYVTGGWQLARGALVANTKLASNTAKQAFYEQKIAICLFYANHILPRAHSHARIVFSGGSSLDAMDFNLSQE